MDRPLVALDTETASPAGPPHLVELGAVRVVEGEATDHFQALVRPLVPVDPAAQAVHGLGDEDLAGARPAPEVLAAFFEWLGDEWLVAHDARADAHVLGFECARHGLEPPANPMLDTLRLARKLLPEAPDHALATLTQHLELEARVSHRALDDAVACWKVLEACAELLGADGGAARLAAEAGTSTTLAGSVPRRPNRRPSVVRALEGARREEQAVWILYGARAEPPARLEVVPRLIFQDRRHAYLEAEDLRSGTLKTYRLDRLHRVEAS